MPQHADPILPWWQGQADDDDIIVAVNKDHSFVQEALKARPFDRMALNVMIVDELARAIVEVDDGILIRKIFHRDVASAIYGIEHKHHRSRIVARRLIDRVRVPAMAAWPNYTAIKRRCAA